MPRDGRKDGTVILQSDYAQNSLENQSDPEWYGVNAYLLKTINCCWSVGARAEWFRDDDGVRVGPAGDYYEITLGANWRPTSNVVVRPELRYDWFGGAGTPFDPVGGVGTASSLFTAGFDAILTF